MKLYNYDYSDMMDIPFYNARDKISMTSKVYPTKLEIKMDKEMNRPYLYYEGIVQTNKGQMKVTFPKLDLALDCISVVTTIEDERDFLGFRTYCKVNEYQMTTKFSNVGDDFILYKLQLFNEDDYKDAKKYFDDKYGK